MLRLLRPAEAATRRLIIIAARGLTVTLPKFYERKPRPQKPPLNRKNGYGTGLVIRPGPLPEWIKAFVPKRSPRLSLPLLDPMKRFGVRRKYAKPSMAPSIRLLGDDGPIVPFFRRPEPLPPPAPTPDDPLDARGIHRRLDVLASALDDLPKQAMRMARWQARRDARLAGERADAGPAEPSQVENSPLRLALRARHLSPISWGRGMAAAMPVLQLGTHSSPPRSGGEVARAKPETERGLRSETERGRVEVPTPLTLPGQITAPPPCKIMAPQARNQSAASTASPRCGRGVRPAGGANRTTTSTKS